MFFDFYICVLNVYVFFFNAYLIDIPLVDYQHSETNVSALMIAAGRGNVEITDQFLSLGASLHLKSANGWTAIEWANHFGHKDCEELLAGQWCVFVF